MAFPEDGFVVWWYGGDGRGGQPRQRGGVGKDGFPDGAQALERDAGVVAGLGDACAGVVQRVQRDDLEVQVGRPAAVDACVAEPADHVARAHLSAGCEVDQGGVVEVAVEGVEAGAVRGGVAEDDGGAVVAMCPVVFDRDDGAGQGRVDGGAGGREEVEAEVDGTGFVAVVSGRAEGGGVVDQAGLTVAPHADGGSGGGDPVGDPALEGVRGRARVAGGCVSREAVRVRQLQASDGQVECKRSLQPLGRHHRRAGFCRRRPRHHGLQGGVRAQVARFPDPELGDPPVGRCKGIEQLPGPLLAHGQVLVVRLARHFPRLHAYRKAEPQRDHGDDRGALGIVQARHRGVTPRDRARRLDRVRQPHHGVGRRDRHLGGAPAVHDVPEVDQPGQARVLQRWDDHHVVVVGVVVDDARGERIANRVKAAQRAVEGRPDQIPPLGQIGQMRADGHGRRLHPPGEVAVELRVIEAAEREVDFRQQRTQGFQNRHRAGAQVGEWDPFHECDGGRHVGCALEVDVDERAGGWAGKTGCGTGQGHRSRDCRRKRCALQVPEACRDEVEDRQPRPGAELQDDISAGTREVEVQVELAGQGGGLAPKTERVPGDGDSLGALGGCGVGPGPRTLFGHSVSLALARADGR